ncbi:ANTAR domain-containing response regulator [Caproiciproducens sp. R1]|uniref:ANTAR domain-containing response regulator n=1 Tax=Caproiciproducens sp. R1 TaxID=3435000 RepID=UPI004033E676
MSSILVANSNADYAKKIAAVLRTGGLNVSGVCTTGSQVIDFANRHYHGGVVVCSVKLMDMPALNLPRSVGSNYDFLFIVKSQQMDISESLSCASLIMPINRMDLLSSVNMLLNISDYSSLTIKKKIANGNYDEKQVIEQAKNILMERNNFTEPQAHRFIQKKSMDSGKKMIETAMIILNL